jgi:transcription termination factor Rho
MDDVIYEEFKGTGNMEIHLDRHLAELRIFPAIDVKRSGTRREELLISEKELEAIWNFRNLIANDTTADSSKKFIELIKNTKNNDDLLNHFSKGVR